MKARTRMGALFGISPARQAPAPDYQVVSDGLIVTARHAEAWFVLRTSNTDQLTELSLDGEVTDVIRSFGKVLTDRECHLKVVWSRISGDQYLDEASAFYSLGNWQDWAAARADRIDELALPQRHLLLGVNLGLLRSERSAAVRAIAGKTLGVSLNGINDAEIKRLTGLAQRIGRGLQGAKGGRVALAPVETLGWLIEREFHRSRNVIPRSNRLTGAAVATLARGRVRPFADHLRVYDGAGAVTAYQRVLSVNGFPESMTLPGEADWLRSLSGISRIAEDGSTIPVAVDASVRFRILPPAEALKQAEDVRAMAKDQRRAASKGSAEDPPEEVLDSEATAAGLVREIRRDGVQLIESWPRLIVGGSTLDELEENTDAVLGHFTARGIDVATGEHEQRELWLEQLPSDQLRVPDLRHMQDSNGFFSALWWGGSEVGDSRGPVIGYLTGSTPGLVRHNVNAAAVRGDATTTAILGRSGRGKTTLMMQLGLEAVFGGAWATLLDFKGDAGGVITVAKAYGLPAELIQITEDYDGACDLFTSLPRDVAPVQVATQLGLLVPAGLQEIAETALLAAVNAVAETEQAPSSWHVVQRLIASQDPGEARLGHALHELGRTGIGRLVLGRPSGRSALTSQPGLWMVQLPGLSLPGAETDPSSWNVHQRLSIVAMRGVIAHALALASSQPDRSTPKLVGVPEVHRLLRTSDGRDFLDQIARMGRAFYTSLILDSQDVTGIASVEGVLEQISSVFGFQLKSPAQQDALASVLGLEVGDTTRASIDSLGHGGDAALGELGTDNDHGIRKGHTLFRDWRDQIASVQIDLPTRWIIDTLNTNPTGAPVLDDESSAVDAELVEVGP